MDGKGADVCVMVDGSTRCRGRESESVAVGNVAFESCVMLHAKPDPQ